MPVGTDVTVLDASRLEQRARKILNKAIPDPSEDLRDEENWVQITIKNATQFHLLLTKSHLDSGQYWTAPSSTAPFEQITFSACDRAFHRGERVRSSCIAGGNAFQIYMKDQRHPFNFSLGWMSSSLLDRKACVKESNQCYKNHCDATDTGNSIFSANEYTGYDEHSVPTDFKFHISVAPGWDNVLVVITQLIV